MANDEIDTIFEVEEDKAANALEQLKPLSGDISVSSELGSTKADVSETAALPEKTFTFPTFPGKFTAP